MLLESDVNDELVEFKKWYVCTNCKSKVTNVCYLDLLYLHKQDGVEYAVTECPECGTHNRIYLKQREMYVLGKKVKTKQPWIKLNGGIIFMPSLFGMGYYSFIHFNFTNLLLFSLSLFILMLIVLVFQIIEGHNQTKNG